MSVGQNPSAGSVVTTMQTTGANREMDATATATGSSDSSPDGPRVEVHTDEHQITLSDTDLLFIFGLAWVVSTSIVTVAEVVR